MFILKITSILLSSTSSFKIFKEIQFTCLKYLLSASMGKGVTKMCKAHKARGFTFPDFKTSLIKSIIIKRVWYWHKDRHIDQWKTEIPEINPCLYNQMIFNQSSQDYSMGKRQSISSTSRRGTRYSHAREWSKTFT